MPATITHGYFALDLYNKLPYQEKKLLEPFLTKFKMFAQGSDSLMFDFLPASRGKKSGKKLQGFLHKTDTRKFFINLITIIKERNLDQNPEILSYLYGCIAHYCLDSTVHPFVVFSTGFVKKGQKETYKYNNMHAIMEVFIDMDMVAKRTGENPYQFKFHSFLFDLSPFSKELKQVIDSVYLKTYGLKNMGKIYQRSFKEMALCLRIFRYDQTGFKRICYRILNSFTPKSFFRIDALSYHVSLDRYKPLLNDDHQEWVHPARKELKSTESFQDLYEKALELAIHIIQKVHLYYQI